MWNHLWSLYHIRHRMYWPCPAYVPKRPVYQASSHFWQTISGSYRNGYIHICSGLLQNCYSSQAMPIDLALPMSKHTWTQRRQYLPHKRQEVIFHPAYSLSHMLHNHNFVPKSPNTEQQQHQSDWLRSNVLQPHRILPEAPACHYIPWELPHST